MATARDIATRVISTIEQYGEEVEGYYLPDIAKMIPDCIREVVMRVIQSGDQGERSLMSKDFVGAIVPVASAFDTVDLTSFLSAAEQMILSLPFSVSHPDTPEGELLWCADPKNLKYVALEDGYNHYSVDGKTLQINADPELVGNVTISSFYVPSVTNLAKQFETELVNCILMKLGITQPLKKR
jgi:hypothetical protein